MTDLIERLRCLTRLEHDDLSIGDEAANEIERLGAELASFKSAVAHVTEDGKTRRSFSASEGWAMVHRDRLLDLEVAEEELEKRTKSKALAAVKEKELAWVHTNTRIEVPE